MGMSELREWREARSPRPFEVTYGLIDRKTVVIARSSLEAGREFINANPGEEMHSITEMKNV